MTKTHLIYIIEGPTGKFYVGRTCNFISRMRRHETMTDDCRKLNRAIQKYGWEKFEVSVLEDGLTFDSAKEREEYFITMIGTVQYGYNILKGGEGFGSGKDCINYGRKHTDEHRQKNSDAKKGELNPNWGKPRLEETRQKISESHQKIPIMCTYLCVDMSIVFESLVEASKFSGVHTGRISCIINQRVEKIRGGTVSVMRKTAQGFTFKKLF